MVGPGPPRIHYSILLPGRAEAEALARYADALWAMSWKYAVGKYAYHWGRRALTKAGNVVLTFGDRAASRGPGLAEDLGVLSPAAMVGVHESGAGPAGEVTDEVTRASSTIGM